MRKVSSSVTLTNPYGDYSDSGSYSRWFDGKIISVSDSARNLSPLARRVHKAFRSHISNAEFPCVGAKAAINGNCYRFGFYPEMNTVSTTFGLAHDLWEYTREQAAFGINYATFIASFAGPVIYDEQQWEDLLWTQINNLHQLDRTHYNWDSSVSSNPEDSDFSFSFAETGFFIVGLQPKSSRLARRFPWATLVFNTHSQFERLREQNKFERMQQTIRARDIKLQGSLNPNLSDFGDRSDARQYSGRAVEETWKCPFHSSSSGMKKSSD